LSVKKSIVLLSLGAAAMLAACSTTIQKAPVAKAAAAPVSNAVPYRWTHGHSEKGYKAMLATFGRSGLKPGEYVWASKIPAEGEARVVVDLVTQMAYAYRGEQLVGASTISSGKRGKITPLGYWPVLEKKSFHRSRKYNNAPMPFMQRLDSYGIALHGGLNPGYPASNGCVRLPMKFAEKLYGLTKVGSKVVIEG
jgi:lipoprotein-anchoring transpeptidase ErfK/SrfK